MNILIPNINSLFISNIQYFFFQTSQIHYHYYPLIVKIDENAILKILVLRYLENFPTWKSKLIEVQRLEKKKKGTRTVSNLARFRVERKRGSVWSFRLNSGSVIYVFSLASPGGWMDNEKSFSTRTPAGLYITRPQLARSSPDSLHFARSSGFTRGKNRRGQSFRCVKSIL